MIRRVYKEQTNDSRKGDFSYQTKKDLDGLNMKIHEDDIQKYSKSSQNKLINETTDIIAFQSLLEENKTKTKTKHLHYETFQMRRYLSESKCAKIAKVIFNIRAATFDIKSCKQWNYEDNLCVMCNLKEETMNHFMTCESYGRKEIIWEDIFDNDIDKQFEIGNEAFIRQCLRKTKKEEDGMASHQALTAPGH